MRITLVFVFTAMVSSCIFAPKLNKIDYPPIKPSIKYYRVKQGDTLFAISWRAGLEYRTVAKWNDIVAPYALKIGEIIRLFDSKKTIRKTKEPSKQSNKTSRNKVNNSKKGEIKKISRNDLKVRWQWPIKGLITKTFSQSGRQGLDIAGKFGQPVLAVAKGKVVYSGSGLVGYGNLVIVKHNEKFLSAYGNNRRLIVKEGQWIRRGQKIAELNGRAGQRSVLHFEIRSFGKPVNPLRFLPKR